MARRLILGAAASLILGACGGGGGKSVLVSSCVDEGESRENCQCLATKLEEGLSPKAFDAVVLGAQGKDAQAEEAMKDLSMSDAMTMAGVMLGATQQCGMTGFGG
ncbi:MAG: hypothetical protein AAF719_08710 [Pseudomonadota bacterium]